MVLNRCTELYFSDTILYENKPSGGFENSAGRRLQVNKNKVKRTIPRKSWKNKRQREFCENATSATTERITHFFCVGIVRLRLVFFFSDKKEIVQTFT